MARAFSFVQGAAISALIFPTTLWADINADDVWQNTVDYSAVFGGALTADLSRSGDTVSVSDLTYTLDLPLDAGRVTLKLGSADLTENGDGTVNWLYPDALEYQVTYSGPNSEDFSADLHVSHEGMTMVASGDPNDITYDWEADRLEAAVDRIPMPDGGELTSMTTTLLNLAGKTRVTVGDMVKLETSYESGAQTFEMRQSSTTEVDGQNVRAFGKGGASSMKISGTAAIPREGMSILNLAAALRDGLSLTTGYSLNDYYTQQIVEVDGATLMTQVAKADSYGIDLTFDANGLSLSGPSENIQVEMEMMDPMPLAIKASIDTANAAFVMPLLKGGGPAPVTLSMDLKGIALDESLWVMFDPEQMLDRSPADLTLDLSGTAKNNLEWLDVLNVETALATLDMLPVEMQDLTLNALHINAVGTELDGNGALTFDNNDLKTYDGFPRPDGKFSFDIKGINNLLDILVAMGMMPEQQASGARMGLAMFSTPASDGADDHLTSEVEMTPEGHVIVNGNRLK